MRYSKIMGERKDTVLKKIRKALGYKNQKDFAETLFLSQGGYSDLETGRGKIFERHILLLERIHNVNGDYIRSGGEGEMFKPISEQSTIATNEIGELKLEIERLRKQNESLLIVIQSQQDTISSLKDELIKK